MKKKGFIRSTISQVTDVPTWVDFGFLQASWVSLRRMTGKLLTPRKAQHIESFEDAMNRLELSETDITNRTKEFSRLVMIFMGLAFMVFIYTLYLAATGDLRSTLFGFVVTLLILVRAFHYHFWLFQVKSRKLGCTLREWLDSTITGEH